MWGAVLVGTTYTRQTHSLDILAIFKEQMQMWNIQILSIFRWFIPWFGVDLPIYWIFVLFFNFFILSKIQNTGYFYSLWQAFIPSCKGLGLCPLLCPWLPLANQVRRTFTVILVTVIVIAIFIGIITIMISWYQHCRNHQRSQNQGSYPQNYDHHLHNTFPLASCLACKGAGFACRLVWQLVCFVVVFCVFARWLAQDCPKQLPCPCVASFVSCVLRAQSVQSHYVHYEV